MKDFIIYYKPHKKLFLQDMLCAVLVAVCNLFYPVATRTFINNYVPNRNLQMIIATGAFLFFTYLLKAALNYFIQYYGHIMGVRMQSDMRQKGFNHLQTLPFSYFDQARAGGIMSRLINDTNEIAELAHHGPEDLFISTITLVGAFLYLSTINLSLTLVIFAFIPVLILYAIHKRVKLSKAAMKARVEIGDVNSFLENSIAGVRVSKAYDAYDYETEKFSEGNKAVVKAKSDHYKVMAEFFSTTGLIIDLYSLVTMLLSAIYTYQGTITIGDFTAYLLFVSTFTEPIKKLINFVEQYQAGTTGFMRLQELLNQAPEQDAQGAVPLTEVHGQVEYRNISFRYNTGHEDVFENLNLTITAGQTIALVGPSGGGKSTLCHLLPRFYELDEGEILLDGVAINQYTRLSLRQQIGIVQQDTFLFTGTIRDNISYGNFSARNEEIIAAAKLANIHDYIATLPEGYDTFIGERGVMLSGGQKQRISIARVFLKNPPILILDEATSALDNTTELAIQVALNDLSKGRTTMVVAHRLSTIQNADKIIYISQHKIQEQGTHEELLAHNEYYAKLWNAQQKR